jgi:hypothetical protein
MILGWSAFGLVWGIAFERSRLSLHLAIWAKWASWQKRLTESCGKSAPPLQSVKTKYLAVSPVTDNFERLDFEVVQGSPHANFLKLKFVGWTVNMAIGASVYRLAGRVPFLCASVCRDRSPKPSCPYVVIEDLTFGVSVYRPVCPVR